MTHKHLSRVTFDYAHICVDESLRILNIDSLIALQQTAAGNAMIKDSNKGPGDSKSMKFLGVFGVDCFFCKSDAFLTKTP